MELKRYLVAGPFQPATYLLQTSLLGRFIVMVHVLKVVIFLTAEFSRRGKKVEAEFKITLNNLFFLATCSCFTICFTYCSKMTWNLHEAAIRLQQRPVFTMSKERN